MPMTLKEVAKRVKIKPAVARSRLRRELSHNKGARWVFKGNQLPKVMRILKKSA